MSEPGHAHRVGAILGGRYRLRRLLGEGGMGAVYEAEDPRGATFAIKVLLGLTGDRELTARFAREARLMATISHPNVTRVIDSGVDPTTGHPYLVMELLSGEDVESLRVRCGKLSPVLAVRILLHACAGLEAAHASGIIHRDVKPANIFLHNEPSGAIVVKVCDFGIARQLFAGETMTRSGDTLGSPSYMSPEQARDAKRVDGRTDVWSLGMTLYELLSGATAFEQARSISEMLVQLTSRDAPALQDRAPWIAEALALVVHGALIRDVDERCPNVGALMGALRPLSEGSDRVERASLAPLSREIESQRAARAGLPRSWKDVELRVRSELPRTDRQSTMVRLLGRSVGGRYRLLGVLGRGGMGAVYETRGPSGERLAVKVIQGEGALKPDAVTRFLREARTAMSLTSPHVVRVFDAGTDSAEQMPFIVMELLEGQDLSALLRNAGAVEPGAMARVFIEACWGLADAHAHGIVHRDIKPANIFLHELPSGEVVTKICDFGVAKQIFVDDSEVTAVDLTRTGGVLGSPMYFSPEQARNAKQVDARTDIWSLCITLYEAVSGRRPWAECSSVGEIIIAVSTQDVTPLQELAPWIQPELAAVIHRGLRRDPAERWVSMAELAAALEPFATPGRLRSAMLAPASAELRSRMTARMVAPVSSKTAYAATIGASGDAAPLRKSSSAWLVAVGLGLFLLAGLGVGFRHRLLAVVKRGQATPIATAAPEPPQPPAVGAASGVGTATAPALGAGPAPGGPSTATIASAQVPEPAPAKSARRPGRGVGSALAPSSAPLPAAPPPSASAAPSSSGFGFTDKQGG